VLVQSASLSGRLWTTARINTLFFKLERIDSREALAGLDGLRAIALQMESARTLCVVLMGKRAVDRN